MRRIQAKVTIDADAVSPDSLTAAQTYLTGVMFDRANALRLTMDWSSWRCHTRRRRNGELVLTQWAKVLKA